MNAARFQREKDYGAALFITGSLWDARLITAEEYSVVRAALIKKYRPMIGSLRDSDSADFPEKGHRAGQRPSLNNT